MLLNNKIDKSLIFPFLLGMVFLLNGCGSDRAGSSSLSDDSNLTVMATPIPSSHPTNVLGENKKDTDKDGLSDAYEINISHTDPYSPDTDGDCLLDSYEVKYYETNATNKDTDGDMIPDGIEIYSYVLGDFNLTCLSHPETLATPYNHSPAIDNLQSPDIINALDARLTVKNIDINTDIDRNKDIDTDKDGLTDSYEINVSHTNPYSPDTDGDCLLDSYEIKYYETNATNKDTDGDMIPDGIEIYSYVMGESNLTCLSTPETLATPYNHSPAIDNLQSPDIINALDPRIGEKDSDGDGISDKDEKDKYGTNPFSSDSDNDGLTDGEEVLLYRTEPLNPDTDSDGLKDGSEVNHLTEPTNPLKKDSDSDGLSDFIEVKREDLNASNSDTDGDCLLDSYEVNNYKTKPNDIDTDKDGVEDGIEIYGDLETSCINEPESLVGGVNLNPAQDNLTNPDVIDALDPLNDSDGDKQANFKELECEGGNPKDINKLCPYIINSTLGDSLVSAGFIYVPGGFDVDGDGINESGFWVSAYHARTKENQKIEATEVNTIVGKFNPYIQKKFFMVNATETISKIIHGYSNETLDDTLVNESVPFARILEFSSNLNPEVKKRLSGVTPLIATVSLSKYEVRDSNNSNLGLSLTLPSLKQYVHIQMLLDADRKNGGNGSTIRNALLGVDKNVPLIDYGITIHEFGEGYKEYLNSIMQMKEGDIVICTGCPWVEPWMGINKDRLLKNPNEIQPDGSVKARGTDSKLNVGMGVGPTQDDYGVLVRAGEVLDLTIGVVGSISDANGKHDGISFRAASPYL